MQTGQGGSEAVVQASAQQPHQQAALLQQQHLHQQLLMHHQQQQPVSPELNPKLSLNPKPTHGLARTLDPSSKWPDQV